MEIVKKRRTTRVYQSEPIPDEFIDKVIEAGRWAPTGANSQPFEFLVVRNGSTRKKIRQIFEETTLITSKAEKPSQVSKRSFLEKAPVLILVLGDPRFKEAYPRGEVRDEIFHAGLSAAVQNMHLAAASLGLGGSVWTTVAPMAAMKIKELLNIPQIFTLKTIMPLGYPRARPSPPSKREPVVHRETYDMTRFKRDDDIQDTIEKTTIFKGKLSHKWKL